MHDNDQPSAPGVAQPVEFLQTFVLEIAGSMEEVVGLEEAKGYMSIVGAQLGARLARAITGADPATEADDPTPERPWSTEQLGEVLVGIEARIGGGFRSEVDGSGDLVLENDRCPFGAAVKGRPSLCMVTSNLFGRIAADRLGHVSVEISESIARGDQRCVVRIGTRPDLELSDDTRHYFADS